MLCIIGLSLLLVLILLVCLFNRKNTIHKKFIIITAFQPEYAAMMAVFDRKFEETYDHGVFSIEGKVHGVSVVLAMSGIAMTNAARTTQLLIDRYGKDNIIGIGFAGIAGGVDANYPVGTVFVPHSWINHALQIWITPCTDVPSYFTIPYIKKGYQCAMNKMGLLCKKYNRYITFNQSIEPNKESKYTFKYFVNQYFFSRAQSLQKRYGWLKVEGVGGSGDIFVADSDYVAYLRTIEPKIVCFGMETQSSLEVASYYDLPFISARIISDFPTTVIPSIVSSVGSSAEIPAVETNLPIERLAIFFKSFISKINKH